MTREEAINKLEHLINSPVGREEIDETCYEVMKYLSTQKPVAVIPAVKKDGELLHEGNCPVCGMKLDWFYNGNYCGCCGQEVKWDA